MKKPITKWVIVAVLALLIAYSGFATYNWLEGEGIENRTLNDVMSLSDIPLRELSVVGLVAESLIKPNATDELVRERTTQYVFHALTLSSSSSMLQALTNEEEYWPFETAMHNLVGFFAAINNGPNTKEILTTNLDTLKRIDDILEEIPRINNLTSADAEELLELSGNLTTG